VGPVTSFAPVGVLVGWARRLNGEVEIVLRGDIWDRVCAGKVGIALLFRWEDAVGSLDLDAIAKRTSGRDIVVGCG